MSEDDLGSKFSYSPIWWEAVLSDQKRKICPFLIQSIENQKLCNFSLHSTFLSNIMQLLTIQMFTAQNSWPSMLRPSELEQSWFWWSTVNGELLTFSCWDRSTVDCAIKYLTVLQNEKIEITQLHATFRRWIFRPVLF